MNRIASKKKELEIVFKPQTDFGELEISEAQNILEKLLDVLEKKAIYLFAYHDNTFRICKFYGRIYFLMQHNINEIQRIFRNLNKIFNFAFNKRNKYDIDYNCIHNYLKNIFAFKNNEEDLYINNGNIIIALLLMGYSANFIIDLKKDSFKENCFFKLGINKKNLKIFCDIEERISFIVENLRNKNFGVVSFLEIKLDYMLPDKISIIVFKALLL